MLVLGGVRGLEDKPRTRARSRELRQTSRGEFNGVRWQFDGSLLVAEEQSSWLKEMLMVAEEKGVLNLGDALD